MVGLIDIAPNAETVEILGTPIAVHGVSVNRPSRCAMPFEAQIAGKYPPADV